MRKKAFIITLTGPSMCGKSYIMETIEKQVERLKKENILFQPFRMKKYTTRSYRLEEIKAQRNHLSIDVESVEKIPEDCTLIYQTYGQSYGLSVAELHGLLEEDKSPVIIINDVRVVEELKREFSGKVLSLFLFRKIPKKEDFQDVSKGRGNVSEQDVENRYNKAISIYRTYIENIALFDRVILNVKNYDPKVDLIDYTTEQVYNVIKGVINKNIELNNKKRKMNRLFIISGSAASGKDDIIRAVKDMGKMQAFIIPKYTTRWQEPNDDDEIICKYVPKSELIKEYERVYQAEKQKIKNELEEPFQTFISESKEKYKMSSAEESFEDFCAVRWQAFKLDSLRGIKTALDRFWEEENQYEERLKKEKNIEVLNDDAKKNIIELFFELNPKYLDIEEIRNENLEEVNKIIAGQESGVTGPSYYLYDANKGYVIYENNKASNNKYIKYAFELENKKENISLGDIIKKNKKHCVLVASLVDIFKICRKKLGEHVVTIFAYSQISADEYAKKSKESTVLVKASAFSKDLERYSKYIEHFDHVTIYAESVLGNNSGGAKEELIDQMFRLFRAYN